MYIKKIPETDKNEWFQHGACEYLANELYKEFGYRTKVLAFIDNYTKTYTDKELLAMSLSEYQDSDICGEDSVVIVHAFAQTTIRGKTYYIDSTGITNNIEDIIKKWENAPCGGHDFILIDFENPADIRNRFWSTYYDFLGDDDYDEFIDKAESASKDFVKEHKRDLDVNLQLKKRRERDER